LASSVFLEKSAHFTIKNFGINIMKDSASRSELGNVNDSTADRENPPSGLTCLVAILRLHGITSDVSTLQQRSGIKSCHVTRDDLVRQARRNGLRARTVEGREWDSLSGAPLPAIGRRIDGAGFFILVRIAEDISLAHFSPWAGPRPALRQSRWA